MASNRKAGSRGAVAAVVLVGVVVASAAATDTSLARGLIGPQDVFDHGASFRQFLEDNAAADELVRACMDAAGYGFVASDPRAGLVPGAAAALEDLTMSDATFAASWGFATSTIQDFVPAGPDGVPVYDPLVDDPTLDPGYLSKLHGTEFSVGCHDAARPVFAGNEVYDVNISQIKATRALFAKAPAMVARYAGWSACMATKGWAFASPLAAMVSVEDEMDRLHEAGDEAAIDTTLRVHEVRLAVDTVACGGPSRDMLDDDLGDLWADLIADAVDDL